MMGIKGLQETLRTDFAVIGAGVAGMRAAIELARAGNVLVVAKDSLKESSSEYAQGGVAVALGEDDDVGLHEADTLLAGDGLCDREAVRVLVGEGPAAIRELIEWGAGFDREEGRLVFAREGAHSRRRVLHAQGDSTGREIARALYQRCAGEERIGFRGFSAVAELLRDAGGRVVGAVAVDEAGGRLVRIETREVLLATGGLGRVYEDTTNPEVATGDGVAMAWRAGARIGDIEFVQFHPTALHVEGAPRFLLSEALRGEGARLLNSKGERFVDELKPRDVVARAIVEEMAREGGRHVWLDLSWKGGGYVAKRFPRIHATCLKYGIDLDKAAAPVHPAAHYAMGGVRTDLEGRTSVAGLWAAGEVASTGVHGANRLASNSLLEGVVYGARAGRAMAGAAGRGGAGAVEEWLEPVAEVGELRRLAVELCGIVRSGAGLRAAAGRLASIGTRPGVVSRAGVELASTRTVLELIARCGLAREESRGAHRRIDYPEKSPSFERHSIISREQDEVTFE